jgi:GTP-binding protein
MAAEFVVTIGDVSNFEGMFNGKFLKGRGEPRIAMVGRSNVGKSSLINALVQTKVAQVSKEPGKTRSIHFYLWKDIKRIIADLPGYGYARTSKDERERWSEFIDAYFVEDQGLERALVLLDARHGPTALDADAIRFLSSQAVDLTFVMTKVDQIKTQAEKSKRKKEVAQAIRQLGFDPHQNVFWVSAQSKDGLKELAVSLSSS